MQLACAVLALALLGMTAQAEPRVLAQVAHADGPLQLAPGDRVFIKDAAESSRFQTGTSQLAMQQAASPQLRDFAGQLVRERKPADQGLLALSQSRGLTPPMMTAAHRKTLNELTRAHGAGFDRLYLDKVGLQSHHEGIKGFEKASVAVKDPQLKAWIDQTLPLMRNHLAQAQKLSTRR